MKSFSFQSLIFSLNSNNLKQKSVYSKKVINYTSQLKVFLDEKEKYKKLNSFLEKADNCNFMQTTQARPVLKGKKGPILLYSICFSFTAVNSFLYITDTSGKLRFSYSAGLFDFKGKSKKSRFLVLKSFFKELHKLKISIIKNKPISLFLNNVGSYRYRIIKHLKKSFFIKVVKNFQTHPYNGCRYKKKSRK
jgi:ribosomal protein S11